MLPNKTKEDKYNSIFFECECHGKHFIEFRHNEDNKWIERNIWVTVMDYPNSLWSAIKWWWEQRKTYVSELELSPEDVTELVKVLNRYLKKIKNDDNNRNNNNTSKTK